MDENVKHDTKLIKIYGIIDLKSQENRFLFENREFFMRLTYAIAYEKGHRGLVNAETV